MLLTFSWVKYQYCYHSIHQVVHWISITINSNGEYTMWRGPLTCRKEKKKRKIMKNYNLMYLSKYNLSSQVQEGHYHCSAMFRWEPEGHYHHSTTFYWEPEGHYHHGLCTVITSFWFSTEHYWLMIMSFWISTDDLHVLFHSHWL